MKFKVHEALVHEDGGLFLHAENIERNTVFRGHIRPMKFIILIEKCYSIYKGAVCSYEKPVEYSDPEYSDPEYGSPLFETHNSNIRDIIELCKEWIRVHHPKSHTEIIYEI